MKFSSSLKFNAVPEWWDEYIAYDALKKTVYQLEKQQAGLGDSFYSEHRDLEASEETALMSGVTSAATDSIFVPLLDRELKKTCLFYDTQEKELVQEQEEVGPDAGHQYMDAGTDDDDEDDDDEDDFDAHSPVASRDPTRSPSRPPGSRRHARSASSAAGASRGRRRYDSQPTRRYSISSVEDHGNLEASIASLRSQHYGQASGSSQIGSPHSPKVTTKTIAAKVKGMKDSITSLTSPQTVWTAKNNYATDIQLLFKRRITNLYLTATSMRSYVELNYSGFRKILKKYDKVTDSALQEHYLHDVVEQAQPFSQATKDHLNATITLLVELYTKCVTHGDHRAAQRQLQLHQREHIAWERDTPEKGLLDMNTKAGHLRLTIKQVFLFVSVLVFVILLNVKVVDGVEASRCLAVLVFATIMWATEAIPLFVTSIFVPLLLVTLRVIRSPDGEERLSTPDATKYIFSVMFSPTIMLLIGGFTIASALSKTAIDRVLITKYCPACIMGVACFASMWISNVAAPTLCFSLIQPILRTLPPKSKFAPCLIIGIALAANIGGQSSPISSPQNLIALHEMDPQLDWASWFAVALPVSGISVVLIWLLLLVSYRPARSPDGEGDIEIRPIRASREPFTMKQWWVTLVCLVTIALWCFEHQIEDAVGDMGIIAIIPIVAFFSTGVLKKEDFEQFLWTVVFLAMGGIALGKGVTSSGLLEVMDDGIREMISGLSLYTVVIVLSCIVLVVSTFISHTIASVLLVPIAKEVGANMPGNRQNLLIFLTGLLCSTGMGMPVSGFPNQTAANQEDDMGQLYLTNIDFLKNGVPASFIAMMVVATVGFLLMEAIG
ncbi:SPX domain-containing protein [Fomitopsis serialis]|uniref:SPX domain-containing protein n=1 Tax=Fomitopsis serialis TaxID=139415 RepID=UPI002008D546|nr:SPX domain-containing protein [Neoantrodia serialis]KAH9925488.1 SPX domain-containing protein [Neoantrodia serialis]